MKYNSPYTKLFTYPKILAEYNEQLNKDINEASTFPITKVNQRAYVAELENTTIHYQALRLRLLLKQIFYKMFKI
jgi:hypothetical protein